MSELIHSASILSTSFQTSPFIGQEVLKSGKRSIVCQITVDGIEINQSKISLSNITGWEFSGTNLFLTYLDDNQASKDLSLHFSSSDYDLIRKQFNLLKIYHSLKAENVEKYYVACPGCHLLSNTNKSSKIFFCQECYSMFDGSKNLNQYGKYFFNFCPSGYFELLNEPTSIQEGSLHIFQSFRSATKPTLDKMLGNILWMGLWIFLINLIWWPFKWNIFPFQSFVEIAIPILVIFSMMNFLILGYFSTELMLRRAVKPLFIKPLWQKWTQMIQRGNPEKVEAIISSTNHPGLLANLALGFFQKNNSEKAFQYLNVAQSLCSNHPALSALHTHFSSLDHSKRP